MMRIHPALFTSIVGMAATAASALSSGVQANKWSVDAKPTFVLGATGDGTTAEFAFVNGATMLPGGNVMVSDRNDYSMMIVSPAGKIIQQFGRKGQGPGELTNAFFSWNCGKNVVVANNAGSSLTLFTLDGTFVRNSRFGSQLSAGGPYRSACNRNGMFVHYGWDRSKDGKPGIPYRSQVPVWITPADSSRGTLIATVQGSERLNNTFQPLGRETRIALGSDRVYVGEADTYEIKVFDLKGKALPSIKKSVSAIATTKQDLADDANVVVGMMGEKFRKSVEAEYAKTTMPKFLPPYRELLIDADGNLWVRDYARTGRDKVTWTAFGKNGKQLSEIVLPNALEVYEVGKDYVLGRYIDENRGAPEVRSYRLIKK